MAENGEKESGSCCCFCVFVLWLLFNFSFPGLHVTKYALIRNRATGVVDFDHVYHGGRRFIGPWNAYLEFPATVQSIEWLANSAVAKASTRDLTPIQVRTDDGLMVRIDVIAKYFVQKDKVADIYRKYKLNVDNFLISNLRSSILGVAAKFRATQLYEDRAVVARAFTDLCKKVCDEDLQGFLSCWRIDILEVFLDPKIEKANEKRQVEQQRQQTEMMNRNSSLIRSGTEVIESDYDRQIQVVHATAQAQAYNLTSEARANATLLEQVTQAKALDIIQDTVTDGVTRMNEEQLLSYLERSALIESRQGAMVYGAFDAASVYYRNEL